MTPTTPPADLIRGLVKAARAIANSVITDGAPEDGLVGSPPWCANCGAEVARPNPDCEDCSLRAALAAFERRAPLRDDKAFLLALESAIRGRTNWYPEHGWIASVADAIDSALFGTAAKEGSR